MKERNILASSSEIAILLCTYNGEKYLQEQLDSIANQSFGNWRVFASDDGSKDATESILLDFQAKFGSERVIILQGPCKGFGRNFMSLVANPVIQADYYAFCDQDDIWLPDKLERSFLAMQHAYDCAPALYCARTCIVDESLNPIGLSPLFHRPPTFANALVQSIAGANTMLINDQARQLLQHILPGADIVAHDWLTYIAIAGAGGFIHYDPKPGIHYRQHGENLIGANSSLHARIARISKMFSGRFRQWSDQNLITIDPLRPFFTTRNRNTLALFEKARSSNLIERLRLLRRSGVYRQTLAGNMSLMAAAILNKI